MHPDAPPPESGSQPDGALWRALGWQPRSRQLAQLQQLQELLRTWNQRLNLTRLVEGDDYWIAQVFDSLWPLVPLLNASTPDGPAATPPSDGAAPPGVPSPEHAPAATTTNPDTTNPDTGSSTETDRNGAEGTAEPTPSRLEVIDVGTGGGFPGLAVAIALPEARVTLVDSVQRKLDAVAAMAAALGLSERVTLRCERAERTGREADCRGRYQLAMARAVASAPVVAEYLVPLLAPGGRALLYRGQWTPEDQRDLERAVTLLQARITGCEQRDLPAGRGRRTALTLMPQRPCPATYPRAVGLPSKLPLGTTAAAPAATTPRRRRRPGD